MLGCCNSYIGAQLIPYWWHGDGLTLSYSFFRT